MTNPYRPPEDGCEKCKQWYQDALMFVARETAFWVVMFSCVSFLMGLTIGVLIWLKEIQ